MFDIIENHHDYLLPDQELIEIFMSMRIALGSCSLLVAAKTWRRRHCHGLSVTLRDCFTESHFLNGMATNYPRSDDVKNQKSAQRLRRWRCLKTRRTTLLKWRTVSTFRSIYHTGPGTRECAKESQGTSFRSTIKKTGGTVLVVICQNCLNENLID